MSVATLPPRTRVSAAALALSAVALGHALEVASGHVHPSAIVWLCAAIALAAVGVAAPARLGFLDGERPLVAVLSAALAIELGEHFWKPPGAAAPFLDPATLRPFHLGIVAAGALVAAIALGPPRLRRLAVPSLLALHAALGVWLLRTSPSPHIDVFAIHRESLDALLRGANPYALTFRNIYSSTVMYGPEQLAGGRLNFGYCYPPLDLLVALPGHLAGDYRLSFLAAMTLSGALVAFSRPGRVAPLAAALLLFTPRGFYVLEHGWTDPVAALALSATVFAALRAPRLLPLALGALLASKQYSILVVAPAAALLLHGRWRDGLRALLVAAAITLPFLLWAPRAFVWSVGLLQLYSPFRPDALSLLAFVASIGGPRLPSVVGFAAALPATVLGLARGARTAAGFAAASALALLAFFAFNKQAFCNYYFLCIAALAAAVAAAPIAATDGVSDPAARRRG